MAIRISPVIKLNCLLMELSRMGGPKKFFRARTGLLSSEHPTARGARDGLEADITKCLEDPSEFLNMAVRVALANLEHLSPETQVKLKELATALTWRLENGTFRYDPQGNRLVPVESLPLS